MICCFQEELIKALPVLMVIVISLGSPFILEHVFGVRLKNVKDGLNKRLSYVKFARPRISIKKIRYKNNTTNERVEK